MATKRAREVQKGEGRGRDLGAVASEGGVGGVWGGAGAPDVEVGHLDGHGGRRQGPAGPGHAGETNHRPARGHIRQHQRPVPLNRIVIVRV